MLMHESVDTHTTHAYVRAFRGAPADVRRRSWGDLR